MSCWVHQSCQQFPNFQSKSTLIISRATWSWWKKLHIRCNYEISRKNITVSPNKNICLYTDCYISMWLAKLGIQIDAGVDCVRRRTLWSDMWARLFIFKFNTLCVCSFTQPTTLPQGTINMNQCSDVIDGESRTGQKNSLCILTPEKENFIRAECKEIING